MLEQVFGELLPSLRLMDVSEHSTRRRTITVAVKHLPTLTKKSAAFQIV
jgi:hypothetical protein